jgi:hypothetical protein
MALSNSSWTATDKDQCITVRARKFFVLSTIVLCSIPARAWVELPRFEDFSEVIPFSGAPVPVAIKGSSEAQRFQTQLREGAARGPNFAGGFTLVTWGCGTSCQSIAVVRAASGAVVFAPFVSELGQAFRRDSRLLVVNPPAEVASYLNDVGGCVGTNPPTWLATRYYDWDGEHFKLVAESPACAAAK